MNEIDYSPAKEFTGNWWSERIKPFLDFRSYLAQRRRILAEPNVIFAPPVDDKNWKSPLKFAIQGLAVPTLIASLVGSIYFFLVKEPDPTYKQDERKFTEAVTKLQALESRIKAAAPDEMFHFYDESIDRPRDDALKECQRRIATVQSRRWVFSAAPYVDDAAKKLGKVLPPIILILAAYFFRRFLKFGQGRSGSNIDRADEVYLYFITSSLFWTGIFYNIFLVLYISSARTNSQLATLLFSVGCAVFGMAALYVVKHNCKKLQPVFNLPLLEGKRRKKSGHHKIFSAFFWANMVSGIIGWLSLFVAAWAWGIVAMWINRFRA